LTVYHDSTHKDLDNLIRSLARDLSKRFCLDYRDHGPDLVQAGWMGALRASKRYQPRGLKFTTYAYYFIAGDIRRLCRDLAYQRHTSVVMDEAHDLVTDEDPDLAAQVREMLRTEDGRLVLAAELGYGDNTKRSSQARRDAYARLANVYREIKADPRHAAYQHSIVEGLLDAA
jgi:RNA polymerase sigma factor (sigma-70 family)